jgi:outer membrane protein OmpA-like peptidoglycan-associated protein
MKAHEDHSNKVRRKASNSGSGISVGLPGDKYEREADEVARKVVQESNSGQKQEAAKVKRKSAGMGVVQRKTIGNQKVARTGVSSAGPGKSNVSRESNIKRGKGQSGRSQTPALQASSNKELSVSNNFASKLSNKKGGGKPIPTDTRKSMESSLNTDLGNVRLHTDQEAVQMSKDIGANAFTHGNNIYFNQGKMDTSTSKGKELLAHEVVHTMQQDGAHDSIQRDEVSVFHETDGIGNASWYEGNNSNIQINAHTWTQNMKWQNTSSIMHYGSGEEVKTLTLKAGSEGYILQGFWFKISEDTYGVGGYDVHEGKETVGFYYKVSDDGQLTLFPSSRRHKGETIGSVTSAARMDRIVYSVEQAAKLLGTTLILKAPDRSDTESSSSSHKFSGKGKGKIKVVDIEGGYEYTTGSSESTTTKSSNKDLFTYPFNVQIQITGIKKAVERVKRHGTTVFFELGKYRIDDASKDGLYRWWRDEVPGSMKSDIIAGKVPIMIEGYADSLGDKGDNQVLSQNRADAVRKVLAPWIPGDDFKVLLSALADNDMTSSGQSETAAPSQRRTDIYVEEKKTTFE